MAITYVNDLRLSEMDTGDNSGTWGTVTNTNLELIGEALGFGTEAITTNADTHASTIADGSTDPVRAMYVKYTGTLDSACTITIGPNTVNKFYYIENATSGSQNIIIKQGSGATITIPAGDVKAVYLDGAGSGAAVVDAFASLSVVDLKVQDDLTVTDDLIVGGDIDLEGSIDVNGTTNLDAVDIDGAVQLDSTLTVGVDDTGYDVKFFGATSGRYMEFDASEDRLFLRDNTKLVFGNGSDFEIYSGGTGAKLHANNGVLELEGDSVQIWNAAANEAQAKFTADGEVQLYHNGVEKFNTQGAGVVIHGTIANEGATDFTIDVSQDLCFDSGHGDFYFKDAATTFINLYESSNSAHFLNPISDGDIIFQGNDGGSTITALTLDMSAAGAATFNSTVNSAVGQGSTAFYATTAGSYQQFTAASSNAWALGATGGNASPATAASTALGFHNWNNSSWANPVSITRDGITFNTDTAEANALDDYEEGTFSGSTNSGNLSSLTFSERTYTKIGRRVFLNMKVVATVDAADTRTYISTAVPIASASNSYPFSGGGGSERNSSPYENIALGAMDASQSSANTVYWAFIPVATGVYTFNLSTTYET